ncbi:T9SS type A sorting domain-containing protein [bacterium]|nr:T9SS type A sorting domain-containing protein [bacterium]
MRKIMLSCLGLMLTGSLLWASSFTPTLLQLSAPEIVSYKFDGKTLEIPVTITGTPACVLFLVFTRDRGKTINSIQNGYLGWHYVNRIDTCIYVGEPRLFNPGKNVITWRGKDADGNAVSPGTYTYYLWAYDDFSPKVLMTSQIGIWTYMRNTIVTHDEKGDPLPNPVIYRGDKENYFYGLYKEQSFSNQKWIVGGDPDDPNLVETCATIGWCDNGGLAFQPDNHNYFFKCSLESTTVKVVKKWKWVPNSNAELQTDWGDNGTFRFFGSWPKEWQIDPGLISDGGQYLFAVNGDVLPASTTSELIYIDIANGTEKTRINLADWYDFVRQDQTGGREGSGPSSLCFKHGMLVTNAPSTCMNLMLDPSWEKDIIIWANQNGDYTGDKNFEENALNPWICNDIHGVPPYKYNITLDDNLFALFPVFDNPNESFGLYAPDGTGLGYHSFAEETPLSKWGMEIIDYGSAYDGIYTTHVTENAAGISDILGWYFVAHDSMRGIISHFDAVDENEPSGFTVFQNSPNPFNPATTIGFTIPSAGDVSVEVYNAAGQKVAVLAHEIMNAGTHTVDWDASGCSAGVYFYTVKIGQYTKTTKMTVMK